MILLRQGFGGQAQVRFIFLLLCLAAAASFAWYSYRSFGPQVCFQDFCVQVQVLSHEADMKRGLQGREALGPKEGMLFVFPKESLHRFWMKEMKIAIDIIWLDSFGKIITIGADLPPCVADPCSIYAPTEASRYVLEVQANFARQHGLKIGDTLVLKGI